MNSRIMLSAAYICEMSGFRGFSGEQARYLAARTRFSERCNTAFFMYDVRNSRVAAAVLRVEEKTSGEAIKL